LLRVHWMLQQCSPAELRKAVNSFYRRLRGHGQGKAEQGALFAHLGLCGPYDTYDVRSYYTGFVFDEFPRAVNNKFTQRWISRWEELCDHYLLTGESNISRTGESELSIWVMTQRTVFRTGKMPYWRQLMMEMFDDWEWSPGSIVFSDQRAVSHPDQVDPHPYRHHTTQQSGGR